MNRLKRVSWITWRIYWFALPINISVLAFSVDHELTSIKIIGTWGLVAALSHFALIPFIYIGTRLSNEYENWKFDSFYLIVLGVIRGIVISYFAKVFSLNMVVSDAYKIFNSAIGLPMWFFLLATFVESKTVYQTEFKSLFFKAIEKERSESARKRLMPDSVSESDESLVRLQYLMDSMQSELSNIIEKTGIINQYSNQALQIENMIHERIKSTSKEIWQESDISIPKIPFLTLVNISLLKSKLRIVPVVLLSIPYLFVGLYATTDYSTSFFQCFAIALIDLVPYKIFEFLHSRNLLSRFSANLSTFISIPIIFFLFQEYLAPESFSLTTENSKFVSFNVFLMISFPLLVLVFNSSDLVSSQRSEILEFLRLRISGEPVLQIIKDNLRSEKNKEIAEYLHGEVQAGLTASSMLLQRAAAEGDEDLAQEALERAAGLLSQDHQNISYTRLATPEVRLQKIVEAWKGIAEISINIPERKLIGDTCFRNSVSLIEEAITNAVRHGKANNINVSGVIVNQSFIISIIYPGIPFQRGSGGLGSKLMNSFSEDWQVQYNGSINTLTISVPNI